MKICKGNASFTLGMLFLYLFYVFFFADFLDCFYFCTGLLFASDFF